MGILYLEYATNITPVAASREINLQYLLTLCMLCPTIPRVQSATPQKHYFRIGLCFMDSRVLCVFLRVDHCSCLRKRYRDSYTVTTL